MYPTMCTSLICLRLTDKDEANCLDDWESPTGDMSVSTGAGEGQLGGMPATLDDLVLVFRHNHTGEGSEQVTYK